MDLQKSKALLDKINALYKNISGDPRNVSSIERDLMRSYVQQFYECFLDLASTPVVATPAPPAPAEPKPVEPKITLRRPETSSPPPPPVLNPQPEPPKPEPPKVERVPEPAPAPPPPVVEKAPVVETPPPPPVAKPEPAPVAYQAPALIDPDLEDLFSFKTATELSEKLSQLPIGDIKKAIGLNQRISTQNELFGGDAAAFDSTVTALNQFKSYDEAKDYLIATAATKYNWSSKTKKDKAKEFIKLVKRRY